MVFERKPLTRETLRLGIREQIRQSVKDAGFYLKDDAASIPDIFLLRYASETGREDWFDFLVQNGDFMNAKGRIKKGYAGKFVECMMFAIRFGHVAIARKLNMMSSRVHNYLNFRLHNALINNDHEMAELCIEMGAVISAKYRFQQCLKKADDRMFSIIEKNRESIRLSRVEDQLKCIDELLEKRRKKKGKTVYLRG